MTEDQDSDGEQWFSWDEEVARECIGKIVLIGITHLLPEGDRDEQMFGKIVSAMRSEGIYVELMGSREGSSYRLPPVTSALRKANRGFYRLRSTGEVVTDPDYTASWDVSPPSKPH